MFIFFFSMCFFNYSFLNGITVSIINSLPGKSIKNQCKMLRIIHLLRKYGFFVQISTPAAYCNVLDETSVSWLLRWPENSKLFRILFKSRLAKAPSSRTCLRISRSVLTVVRSRPKRANKLKILTESFVDPFVLRLPLSSSTRLLFNRKEK